MSIVTLTCEEFSVGDENLLKEKELEQIIDFIVKKIFKELIKEKKTEKIKNENPRMLITDIWEKRKKYTNPTLSKVKLVHFTLLLKIFVLKSYKKLTKINFQSRIIWLCYYFKYGMKNFT